MHRTLATAGLRLPILTTGLLLLALTACQGTQHSCCCHHASGGPSAMQPMLQDHASQGQPRHDHQGGDRAHASPSPGNHYDQLPHDRSAHPQPDHQPQHNGSPDGNRSQGRGDQHGQDDVQRREQATADRIHLELFERLDRLTERINELEQGRNERAREPAPRTRR